MVKDPEILVSWLLLRSCEVYFFCPEIQSKTLEEVDLIFVSQRLRESSAGKKLVGITGAVLDLEDKS